MTFVTVWRARVPEASVADLLAVRDEAIAEAQQLCPQMLRADLVRLPDGDWFDILTWSVADGEDRLMAQQAEFDALHRMHALIGEVVGVDRGEVRFLGHPQDAEDETQEALIRIVTRLSTFEGRSTFSDLLTSTAAG